VSDVVDESVAHKPRPDFALMDHTDPQWVTIPTDWDDLRERCPVATPTYGGAVPDHARDGDLTPMTRALPSRMVVVTRNSSAELIPALRRRAPITSDPLSLDRSTVILPVRPDRSTRSSLDSPALPTSTSMRWSVVSSSTRDRLRPVIRRLSRRCSASLRGREIFPTSSICAGPDHRDGGSDRSSNRWGVLR